MGSKVRMNYTMMGDAVNLAARLESAAKQYGVYVMISHYTNDLIKNDFETRLLDKITVVGKSEPVSVYELLSGKGEIPLEMNKFLEFYNQGLAYYFDQEWNKAIDSFRRCEVMEPNRNITKGRTPSVIFIERIEEYMKNPPGKGWNGVYNLTLK